MNTAVVEVGFQYVYDLYYRVRNGCLEYNVYSLSFLDWIKAGLAFNVLGEKNIQRRISYFGSLYRKIENDTISSCTAELQCAVVNYYEDLFQLYQDHLVAQLHNMSRQDDTREVRPQDLVLIPCFSGAESFTSSLPREEVILSEYCSKFPKEFQNKLATIYLPEDTLTYRGMSLMFDYGYKSQGNGVILGVKQ